MAEDFAPTGLRVLREVAQTGSFSAAALSLGYTQSAVSRQVAALESAARRRLFDRGRQGVKLTPAGARLLTSAVRVLDELEAARSELAGESIGGRPVRLGAFAAAAAGLVPQALAALPAQLHVSLRVGERMVSSDAEGQLALRERGQVEWGRFGVQRAEWRRAGEDREIERSRP